ncbi:MAG: hypothetical protein ABEH35_04935 [Haloarculaceae archaeon]
MLPELATQALLALVVLGGLAFHERIVTRLASVSERIEPDDVE